MAAGLGAATTRRNAVLGGAAAGIGGGTLGAAAAIGGALAGCTAGGAVVTLSKADVITLTRLICWPCAN